MSAYLFPNLKNKKAYKNLIESGEVVTAVEQTPWGAKPVENGTVCFEGPHYPEPHRFYGTAVIVNGRVVKVK